MLTNNKKDMKTTRMLVSIFKEADPKEEKRKGGNLKT